MRSGQYKLAGAGSRATTSDVTLGHFRSSQSDLAPSESCEFPHMNSLVVTKHKLLDSRPMNKSCENLSSSGARSAVTRVEQRVKSFLQRGESRLRQGEAAAPEGVWQYGHVVTLPRRPKLSLALSHSALHHLSSADTASCLSGSSGYSSSSSSSYGSFKSSTSSSCSTLPRKKSHSVSGTGVGEGHSHLSLARSCTLVDNPMYDVTPATDPSSYKSHKRIHSPSSRLESNYVTPDTDSYSLRDSSCQRQICLSPHDSVYEVIPNGDSNSPYGGSQAQGHENLYDLAGPSRLTPDSGTHGGLDSLEESALDSLDCSDPRNGVIEDDTVKEEDQVAKKCREYFERRLKNSETLKKRWSMCSSDSGADSGDSDVSPSSLPTSASPPSITSHTSQPSTVATQVGASSKKTPIDQKMEFLRKEIASLMSQDNALFRQLLTLHESISALKTTPPHPHRPASPTSLESFTEEEGDDDDDGEEDDDDDQVRMGEKTMRGHENLSDVDEGLDTDHSTSPTSTLSSRDSHFSRSSSKALHTSPDSSPTHHAFHRAVTSPHAAHHSQLDSAGPANLAFMRSRKSYAPTARNRRRSSSAHLTMRREHEGQCVPCGGGAVLEASTGVSLSIPAHRPRSSSAVTSTLYPKNTVTTERPIYREALIM